MQFFGLFIPFFFKTHKGRILLVLAALLLFYGLVLSRIFSIQLGEQDKLDITSPAGYSRTLIARRGNIYDRNGRSHVLAQSVPIWEVFLDPGLLKTEKDRQAVYEFLREKNICSEAKLRRAVFAKKGRYFPLGEIWDRSRKEDIQTNKITRRCTGFHETSRRSYPPGKEFCHILGSVNSRETPFAGLEQVYNSYLLGTNGFIIGEANARRHEIRSRRHGYQAPVNGCDLFLTMDSYIQGVVNEALDEAIEKFRPRSAWAIVQDCNTGEILAMVSRPDFDPGDFSKISVEAPENLWNSAIFKNYEPGSVMKPFVAAAALEEGLIRTNTLFNVDPGLYAGRPLQDHVSGMIDLTTVLQKSSNRGSSRIAELLGKKKQEESLRAFGFAAKTGLPLRDESRGYLPPQPWGDLRSIRIAIGHGISVTGIQLACAYSCLANGGNLMKPILVKSIVNAKGETVFEAKPEVVSTPISEKTSALMREMLCTVAQRGGTGRRAALSDYRVAGKTGTAQIAIKGGYSQTDFCASFVGFVPAGNPRITILVTLEAPPDRSKYHHHGGVSAAPTFAVIAKKTLEYLRIPAE